MIDSKKNIEIYDDTGCGDNFKVVDIFYENDNLILCSVTNDWYEGNFSVIIYKDNSVVSCRELMFYYAENK